MLGELYPLEVKIGKSSFSFRLYIFPLEEI